MATNAASEPKVKPRIYKRGNLWFCSGSFFATTSKVASEAYSEWVKLYESLKPCKNA